MSDDYRIPANLEAEQSVLGGCLLDPMACDLAMETLGAGAFYREAHQRLFATMIDLVEGGEPVDLVTVAEALRHKDLLAYVGGAAYLTQLMDTIPTVANQEYYCKILLEKQQLRKLLDAKQVFEERIVKSNQDPDTIRRNLEDTILSVDTARIYPEEDFRDLLRQVTNEAKLRRTELSVDGLPTGFTAIDHLSYGLAPGELIVVAARPSMGKTQFALCVAWNVGGGMFGQRVDLYSCEMSKKALARRFSSLTSGIDQRTLRLGVLTEGEKKRLTVAEQELMDSQIDVIDTTSGFTPAQLRRRLRRQASAGDLPVLVLIDYLQLMSGGGTSFNRNEEMDKVSRDLKKIAEEYQVPIIVMAQLNREVEKRRDKRPVLSDLRESGGIENNADQVWFIHLPCYYWKEKPEAKENVLAEIILAKGRNNEIGVAQIGCNRATARFYQPEDRELARLVMMTEAGNASQETEKGYF